MLTGNGIGDMSQEALKGLTLAAATALSHPSPHHQLPTIPESLLLKEAFYLQGDVVY